MNNGSYEPRLIYKRVVDIFCAKFRISSTELINGDLTYHIDSQWSRISGKTIFTQYVYTHTIRMGVNIYQYGEF